MTEKKKNDKNGMDGQSSRLLSTSVLTNISVPAQQRKQVDVQIPQSKWAMPASLIGTYLPNMYGCIVFIAPYIFTHRPTKIIFRSCSFQSSAVLKIITSLT